MIRGSFFAILLLVAVVLSSCATVPSVVNEIPDIVESIGRAETQLGQEATQVPALADSLSPFGGLNSFEDELVRIYEQVSPSVVHIQTESRASAQSFQMPDLPFPFPELPNQPDTPQSGLGSGFVWDTDGHIVTNNHVVEGAEKITVTFMDGSRAAAELVGADRNSDLAVIRVEVPSDRLQPIEVADSTRVKVGQLAIAIGNPFGLQGTMTTGIISALGRSLPVNSPGPAGLSYTIPDVIQTDAPINPGNSGGALVDSQGRLIGVPTAIESPVRANAGVGFVVPSVIVQKVVPALIEQGFYEHPWIGISGRSLIGEWAEEMGLDPDQRGALVVDVVPDSPAAEAGLLGSDRLVIIDEQEVRLGGDIIIEIDSEPIEDFEDLVAYLARHTDAGQRVELTLLRDAAEERVTLTLATRPNQAIAEASSSTNPAGGQAWLGIVGKDMDPTLATTMDLPEDQKGVLIEQLVGGGPAAEAGLRGSFMSVISGGQQLLVGGDIIVAIDGDPIESLADLQGVLRPKSPGDRIMIEVLRNGAVREFQVTLAARPSSDQ